jgi:hypothetical protein
MNAVDLPSVSLAEALRKLSGMPGFLSSALVRATPEHIKANPSPGEFSLLEHACHLRDLEREGYAIRLRRMLTENHPVLAGFEGDAVARERDYMSQDAMNAACEFAIARNVFIMRVDRLTQAEMQRTGSFMGRDITVCDLLAMMVEHDGGHVREIAALVRAQDRA